MKRRQWLPLIGVTLGVFVFNMSEFMPIGLLTDIADDFSISESRAGLIISVYAWAVAILSLPIILLLKKMEYRKMLLLCVALFAFFQFLSGVSTSYWMLMASRLGVAMAHSVFWSIAAPLAVKVVEPRYVKIALSTIATGVSIAMIVGLPLGRAIGLALGWRMTFTTIAVTAVAILAMLALVFPRVENPGTFTAKNLPDLFHNKVIVGTYVVIAVYVTGYYTAYSYIEPFFLQTADLSASMVTVMLTVMGAAGIIGSILYSKTYDRTRLSFLVMSMSSVSLSLLIMLKASEWMVAVVAVCAVMGMCHTAFTITIQGELIKASPSDATAIVMSIFSGIFNMGIAMGSIIGGLVTDSSVDNIGLYGFVFTAAATFFAATYLVTNMKRSGEPNVIFRRPVLSGACEIACITVVFNSMPKGSMGTFLR